MDFVNRMGEIIQIQQNAIVTFSINKNYENVVNHRKNVQQMGYTVIISQVPP